MSGRSALRCYWSACFCVLRLAAQNASLSGLIQDPVGAVVPGAEVTAVSENTGARRVVTSTDRGIYHLVSLPPGRYSLMVQAAGFEIVQQKGVILEVGRNAQMDFRLTIGGKGQSITVEGNTPMVNSLDASVSTIIDHRFVENMPLDGRSFSSLIALAPGVVLTQTSFQEQGQFSVNGQRTDANYFMVDGVSANLGTAGGGGPLGQGGAGQLPATSAFGGTSNLVSLDALEEFRIQTSTFAPEYGRTPGGQIGVATRSGTNRFHGTLFEYLRNDALDANDWFTNQMGLPKTALRQSDFGGVLGGPLIRDKLFFFGSYEGLRLRQPETANTYVPSLARRQSAPVTVQPLLNAFPRPTGPDLGNGTATFAAGYSDPSSLNSSSVRLDYVPLRSLTLFGRYSDAPSEIDDRSAGGQANFNDVQQTKFRTQSLTVGANQVLAPRLVNEYRFNYSQSRGGSFLALDDFGGAVPPSESLLLPSFASPDDALFGFFADFNPNGLIYYSGKNGDNRQRQINAVDNAWLSVADHQVKFGFDYRRLAPLSGVRPYDIQYLFDGLDGVSSGAASAVFLASRVTNLELIFANWSAFAQDTWKLTQKLSLTYGVRWDYNGSPSEAHGRLPYTVTSLDNPATMKLAPAGTSLWNPGIGDFAPRLGVAFSATPDLVLRAGAGIFYDLGYADIANGTGAFPYATGKMLSNIAFPLGAAAAAPPPFATSPPVPLIVVIDPHHVLPRTYEWNAAFERTFGKTQVGTLSYVGAAGRDLMRNDTFVNPNPDFFEVDARKNEASSSYQALQAQFRQRLFHGVQILISYTWAHSIDNASGDAVLASVLDDKSHLSLERGPSDFDIRHTLSAAVSYDIPRPCNGGVWNAIVGRWSVDSIVYARTAAPVNVVTGKDHYHLGAYTGENGAVRPDRIPGVRLYIDDPNVAGGKRVNQAAFSVPATARQGTLGRNALRGFAASQLDLTLRRQFAFTERLRLQAQADFFNILNHPNFGNPINYLTSPLFGQSTQMLAGSLGSGGQRGGSTPLYQIGGPRSIQLALKVRF
jgi:carboxypeptidase family protein/TonB-dependent receptor-like protein